MKRHPHRGIILHGRPTSLRLEREFWEFLREIAIERSAKVRDVQQYVRGALHSREIKDYSLSLWKPA